MEIRNTLRYHNGRPLQQCNPSAALETVQRIYTPFLRVKYTIHYGKESVTKFPRLFCVTSNVALMVSDDFG